MVVSNNGGVEAKIGLLKDGVNFVLGCDDGVIGFKGGG